MPSSPTTNLRLELMATGENDNTWGTKANVNIQLLENAITKRTPLNLSNVDVTLSTTNYADDQSRSLCLVLSGTLTGNVNVIVPAVSHYYLVQNQTTGAFTVTVKTPSGTGVPCTQGVTSIVYCDATNVIQPQSASADATTLGGLTSADYARLHFANQFTKGNGHTFVQLPDGGTITADCSISDRFVVVLGGNRTLDLTNPKDGQHVEFWAIQDVAGGRALTFPPNVYFAGGVTPSLSSIGDGMDAFHLTYNLAQDIWLADGILGATGGASVTASLPSNEVNVRIFERLSSPPGAVTVNLTIPAGVTISSFNSRTAALDLSGFASGSIINLINEGLIHGMGGAGGKGAALMDQGSGLGNGNNETGFDGRNGGLAILGPGAGITCNIYNANGRIWGGGGGGGGGGFTFAAGSQNGGGGGGGAGGGAGGGGAGGLPAEARQGRCSLGRVQQNLRSRSR